jgi:two-component system phosphate regulon sensor histidine kinase PhoR
VAGERILVVDDRSENIDFIVEYVLKPNGYRALTARDGEEGLRKVLTENPDLILLDMQMPRMTGIEVLESLKEHGKNIPVILMTFHGSEELAVRVFRLGVKNYIIKPFEIEEMLAAIEQALAEARLRKERDQLTERLMQVNRQLEQRVKELNTLYGIGRSVTSLLEVDRLLNRVIEAASYITGAEEGWLLLVDEMTEELYMRAALGFDEKTARSFRLKVQDSLAGSVVKTGEPVLIGGGKHKIKTAYLVKALLMVPLRVGERVIGILSVNRRVSDEGFTNNELYLLSALADYAAIAIENARLFQETESEHRKLQAILSRTADAVIVTDKENRIILLNQAAKIAFCPDNEVTVDQPLTNVVHNQDLIELFSQATSEGRPLRAEISLDGDRTLYATLSPIEGVGRVAVVQDITHLKKLDQMKSDFVSTVSHDLRSPLTTIKGFVDLMGVVGPLNEQQQDFVNRIQKGVITITELINDLLDIGRIEAEVNLNMERCAFDEVITESVDELRDQAGSKQQTLVATLPPHLPPVWGNPLRLRQVVDNLVNNAIKYTPEGGKIVVWVEEYDSQVALHVSDTGLGIPHADQPYVFDKFYRVHSEETENITGTGLGLAIVKTIVEKHNGRVWVESEPGKGSTFTVLLPVHQDKAAPQSSAPDAKLTTEHPSQTSESEDSARA